MSLLMIPSVFCKKNQINYVYQNYSLTNSKKITISYFLPYFNNKEEFKLVAITVPHKLFLSFVCLFLFAFLREDKLQGFYQ